MSSRISTLDVTLEPKHVTLTCTTNMTSELLESNDNLSTVEKLSVENWRGEGIIKKNRPRKSYLEPQKEWAFIDLADKSQIIPNWIFKEC